MKKRAEYRHKLVIWNQNQKKIKRIIDKMCSTNPLKSRKEIIDMVLWRLHLNGARLKPYRYFKTGKQIDKTIKAMCKIFKRG